MANEAVWAFRKSHPHLKFGENQARTLHKKYLDQEKKRSNVDKEIGTLKRVNSLMLEIDNENVWNFLQIIKTKGGVVNSVVAMRC